LRRAARRDPGSNNSANANVSVTGETFGDWGGMPFVGSIGCSAGASLGPGGGQSPILSQGRLIQKPSAASNGLLAAKTRRDSVCVHTWGEIVTRNICSSES
jgi:hypothetical protein